jgi:hypothetical protein
MQILETLNTIKTLLFKSLIYILPISLIAGSINAYFAKQKKPIYTSYSKIFPMNAEGGNDPTSAIKAQFGISSGSGAGKFYNINELMQSRTLSRKTVQYPTNNAKHLKLYEWIIEDQNTNIFSDSKKIILSKDSLENINTASEILKSAVNIKTEKSDFTSIQVACYNPELALRINECVLNSLSDFYIQSKTEKARKDLIGIKNLKDSLENALDIVERATLGFQDDIKFLVKEGPTLPRIKLERLREEIIEQYRATSTTYSNANFTLLNESPIFQILDKPMTPVNVQAITWKPSFIIAFAITFIFLSLFAIRKPIFEIIMNELKSI